MPGNFFDGEFFGGGFFGANTAAVRGGKGDNKRKTLHLPVKPTGLLDRPQKKVSKEVEKRVEDTRQIHAEIAGKLAKELRGEIELLDSPPIMRMSVSEIDAEIGVLLRKKLRTEEEEILLLMLMCSAVAG